MEKNLRGVSQFSTRQINDGRDSFFAHLSICLIRSGSVYWVADDVAAPFLALPPPHCSESAELHCPEMFLSCCTPRIRRGILLNQPM